MKHLLSTFVLLFATWSHAAVPSPFGASLEWLADTSFAIGTYRVHSSTDGSSLLPVELDLRLDETLKGEPSPRVAGTYWLVVPENTKSHVDVDDRFLVCFKRSSEQGVFTTPVRLSVTHLIHLSHPQLAGLQAIAITSKFEVLTDGAAIVEAVRARMKAHPMAQGLALPDKLEVSSGRAVTRVPLDSPAAKVLRDLKASLALLVPEDLRPAAK